jgi:hypothetical protein
MRHVEHPLVRHCVVVEVKDLLARRAAATHAVVGAILLAVASREDLGDGIAAFRQRKLAGVPSVLRLTLTGWP